MGAKLYMRHKHATEYFKKQSCTLKYKQTATRNRVYLAVSWSWRKHWWWWSWWWRQVGWRRRKPWRCPWGPRPPFHPAPGGRSSEWPPSPASSNPSKRDFTPLLSFALFKQATCLNGALKLLTSLFNTWKHVGTSDGRPPDEQLWPTCF